TGFVSMPRRAGADPLAGADVVIRARFVNQRVAPVPMEVNGALAAFDPDTDGVTVWVPSQAPFAVRTDVARGLGLDESQVHVIADMGAYPMGAYLPGLTRMMACGVYRIPRVQFRSRCVLTNTTPVGAYRGAGRPEAAALIERAMDMVADELDMDPVEIRRRNLIPPEAFPHTTA